MNEPGRILVVAATPRELATPGAWRTLCCGVGPVEAAATTAAALASYRPAAVLHVGIAGARRASGIAPGTVVLGSEARYCDLAVPEDWAPAAVPASPALLEAARRALPDAVVRPIGTSARVGGSAGCDVEAMEGFGVLRAAHLAGVPALEVRVVSNVIEEADRALWRFDDAFAAVAALTPRLVAALAAVAAVAELPGSAGLAGTGADA
jgi:futalosine hydrolase